MAAVPVVIERRYNGPPDSGHGGWSAGQAALQLDAPVAEVTLRRPPPLETPLDVVPAPEGVELRDGEAVVLAARAVSLALDGPPPAGLEAAAKASARFAWLHEHPFPTCFGCGP